MKKLVLSEQRRKQAIGSQSKAYVSWRDKLQHIDFIGERGFNKLISPFQEVIESKG